MPSYFIAQRFVKTYIHFVISYRANLKHLFVRVIGQEVKILLHKMSLNNVPLIVPYTFNKNNIIIIKQVELTTWEEIHIPCILINRTTNIMF